MHQYHTALFIVAIKYSYHTHLLWHTFVWNFLSYSCLFIFLSEFSRQLIPFQTNYFALYLGIKSYLYIDSIPCFIAFFFIARHKCCLFYSTKARPSTGTKIMTHFIAMLTLFAVAWDQTHKIDGKEMRYSHWGLQCISFRIHIQLLIDLNTSA